jgi:hypothetical protein
MPSGPKYPANASAPSDFGSRSGSAWSGTLGNFDSPMGRLLAQRLANEGEQP